MDEDTIGPIGQYGFHTWLSKKAGYPNYKNEISTYNMDCNHENDTTIDDYLEYLRRNRSMQQPIKQMIKPQRWLLFA